MKKLALLFAFALVASAQTTITVTSPTAGATVAGWGGAGAPAFGGAPTLSVSISGTAAASVTRVQYLLDGYPWPNYGWGAPINNTDSAPFSEGFSIHAPFSMPYNSYWIENGTDHVATAIAYDDTGTVVATSAPVTFTVSNNWPVVCGGQNSTSSASLGAVSGGLLPITITVTGNCATDSKTFQVYTDGFNVTAGVAPTPAASFTFNVDERLWQNANHQICWTWKDTTNQTTLPDGSTLPWGGGGCKTVAFSNGATAMEVHVTTTGADCGGLGGAEDCFITYGGTAQLHPAIFNTDGTSSTLGTYDYFAYTNLTYNAVSVNSSGLITANATPAPAGSPSTQKVYVMNEAYSTTTLQNVVATCQFWDNTHPFTGADVNRLIHITGGSGITPGLFQIVTVDQSSHVITMHDMSGSDPVGCAGFALTNLSAVWGPTATVNANTWSSSPGNVSCFGSDARIHTTPNPVCFWVNEAFSSSGIISATQPSSPTYNYYGSTGPAAELDQIGFNAWEVSIIPATCSSYQGTTLSSFTTSVSNNVAAYIAATSSLTHAKYFYGIGDNMARLPNDLWTCTKGSPATWTTNFLATSFSIWSTTGNNKLLGWNFADEVSSNIAYPLMGPDTPGGSNSWLTAGGITCDNTTCTMTTTGVRVNFWCAGCGHFIIHGSTAHGGAINTPLGGTGYIKNGGSGNTITFLSSATAGTYCDNTDTGCTVEPWAVSGYTNGSNTSYIGYDAIATLTSFANAFGAPGSRPPAGGAPVYYTGCSQVAEYSGNGVDGPINGISQVGELNDFYSDASSASWFLLGRGSVNWSYTGTSSQGQYLKATYGCYKPGTPTLELTVASYIGAGQQGYNVNITSITNDVVTFSGDHGVRNIVKGDTKLYIQSTGNATYDNQGFYVTEVLDPTHLRIANGAGYFSGSCASGTLTFAGGYVEPQTITMSSSTSVAQGKFYIGNGANFAGVFYGHGFTVPSPDTNLHKHIGEKFTVSCPGNTTFNTYTYVMALTNLQIPSYGAGSNNYWVVPSGSATGGTATIQPDGAQECGRVACSGPGAGFSLGNATSWDGRATWSNVMASAVAGAAGTRAYKITGSNTYSWQEGWGGAGYSYQDSFSTGRTSGGLSNSTFCFLWFESNESVPACNGMMNANRQINRWSKYFFQNRVASPSLGKWVGCSGRSGSNGNLMLCANTTNGTWTETVDFTQYVQSGQSWILNIVGFDGTDITTVESSATTSVSITLNEGQAFFAVFPTTFAGSINQPTVSPRLADIAGATKAVVRWGYNPYQFDEPLQNSVTCTSFPCTVPASIYSDQGGPVRLYYRIDYLDVNNKRLTMGDMQYF